VRKHPLYPNNVVPLGFVVMLVIFVGIWLARPTGPEPVADETFDGINITCVHEKKAAGLSTEECFDENYGD